MQGAFSRGSIPTADAQGSTGNSPIAGGVLPCREPSAGEASRPLTRREAPAIPPSLGACCHASLRRDIVAQALSVWCIEAAMLEEGILPMPPPVPPPSQDLVPTLPEMPLPQASPNAPPCLPRPSHRPGKPRCASHNALPRLLAASRETVFGFPFRGGASLGLCSVWRAVLRGEGVPPLDTRAGPSPGGRAWRRPAGGGRDALHRAARRAAPSGAVPARARRAHRGMCREDAPDGAWRAGRPPPRGTPSSL